MQLFRYNFMFLIVFTLTFNLLNAQEKHIRHNYIY